MSIRQKFVGGVRARFRPQPIRRASITRERISPAALRVNVIATTASGVVDRFQQLQVALDQQLRLARPRRRLHDERGCGVQRPLARRLIRDHFYSSRSGTTLSGRSCRTLSALDPPLPDPRGTFPPTLPTPASTAPAPLRNYSLSPASKDGKDTSAAVNPRNPNSPVRISAKAAPAIVSAFVTQYSGSCGSSGRSPRQGPAPRLPVL